MWSERPSTGESLTDKHLCLTFDDGPADPATLDIARYLVEQQIPATFFVVGDEAVKHLEAARELIGLGHTLGNHTRSHTRLTASTTTDNWAIEEALAPEQTLVEAGAQRPIPFRAPYGAWNRRLAYLFNNERSLRDSHTGPIGWDIDGEDHRFWREGRSPEDCARDYLMAIESQRSGIVLFHDRTADPEKRAAEKQSANRTPEMIRLLVPQLQARGYRFTGLQNAA
jgi:peptidoglycan-N-acetylglucosamine deacetylase